MAASGGKIEAGDVQGTVQGASDTYMTGMCVFFWGEDECRQTSAARRKCRTRQTELKEFGQARYKHGRKHGY